MAPHLRVSPLIPSSIRAAVVFCVTLWIALGCQSTLLPAPTPVDASRARAKWSDSTVQSLEEGRRKYIENCSGCHQLKAPSAVPKETWSTWVERMRTGQGVKVSDQGAELIVRYLYAMAERAN